MYSFSSMIRAQNFHPAEPQRKRLHMVEITSAVKPMSTSEQLELATVYSLRFGNETGSETLPALEAGMVSAAPGELRKTGASARACDAYT